MGAEIRIETAVKTFVAKLVRKDSIAELVDAVRKAARETAKEEIARMVVELGKAAPKPTRQREATTAPKRAAIAKSSPQAKRSHPAAVPGKRIAICSKCGFVGGYASGCGTPKGHETQTKPAAKLDS